MEDAVIRYEAKDVIIWSRKKKAYFCARLSEDNDEIKEILEGKKATGEVYNELKEIGVINGNNKIVKSSNKNRLMAPLEYYFDFTNVCNLRCSHCYNRENMNTRTMLVEEIKKVITDMYNNGIMRLHLAGGEPTLFPNEMRVYMETAKKYGILTSMASNGVSITDEICKILDENDVMSITISIESANEDENAKIRGKGNLERAIEGIRKLSEYKKIHHSKYAIGIKVSYNVDFTEKEFEDLVKLAKELKVDILKFANPERCVFHEKGYYSKNAEKYYKNMEIVKKLKERYKDEIFITQISSPVNDCVNIGIPNMEGCIGAQELIAINCKGEVTPCLMNDTYLGNIFKVDSIREIYNSPEINNYYKKIRDYECKGCNYHEKCRGGCQVRKIVEYGEIKGNDPICPVRNNIKINNKTNEKSKLMKIMVLHSL